MVEGLDPVAHRGLVQPAGYRAAQNPNLTIAAQTFAGDDQDGALAVVISRLQEMIQPVMGFGLCHTMKIKTGFNHDLAAP